MRPVADAVFRRYGNNSVLVSGGAIGADKTLRDYFARADRFAAPLFSVLTPASAAGVRGRAALYSLDTGAFAMLVLIPVVNPAVDAVLQGSRR